MDSPAGRHPHYVALGDSFTAGIDETPPGTRWPDLVAAQLRAIHGAMTYENLAVGGMETHEVEATQLAAALAQPFDLATLICGGNDVMKNTAPDIDAVAARLNRMFGALRTARPAALIVTSTHPDLSAILPYRERSKARVSAGFAALNAQIPTVAAAHDVRVLDLSRGAEFQSPGLLAADGYHPSVAGQRALYEAIAAQLADEPLLAGTVARHR